MQFFDLWKFSNIYSSGEAPAAFIKRVGVVEAFKSFIKYAHEAGIRICFESGMPTNTAIDKMNIVQYTIKFCPDEKITRMIIEMAPELVNAPDKISGRTAMHYAAESASVDMNQFLYVVGGRPDISDTAGYLPYFYAMRNRRANHVASISLDALMNYGMLKLLSGSEKIKSADDIILAAQDLSETDKYINCVRSYKERM